MSSPRQKKSPSKSLAVSRRSRSRTRKSNQYLFAGRNSSLSQPRMFTNGHTNGVTRNKSSTSSLSRSKSRRTRSIHRPRKTKGFPTTVQLDIISLGLFSFALFFRVWNIAFPSSIVFDELISGAQITGYVRREMYFNLGPPLFPQLLAAAAYLYGNYSAAFEFKEVGTEYSSDVPYVMWRLISGISGAVLASAVYHLLRATQASITSSIIASSFLAIDPSLIVQSRIYSPDTLVMTFSMLALCFALHHIRDESSTSPASGSIVASGFFSALSISMKYSSIFTHLLLFYLVASNLWKNVSDGLYSTRCLCRRFLVITISLVIVPLVVYLSSWSLHVIWLNRASSPASSHHTFTSFQPKEAEFISQPVTNGTSITLRHAHGRSCWLHSHNLLYPKRYEDGRGSSHQQQVTCYPYADINNRWIVVKVYSQDIQEPSYMDAALRDGDIISLMHESTGRLLNSHDVAAPMSPSKQEVSCFIDHQMSLPMQAAWVLEVDQQAEARGEWLSKSSEVKLIHVNTSAALSVTSKQLPAWGGGQFELVADPFTFHENTLWIADDIIFSAHAVYKKASSHAANITIGSTLKKVYKLHRDIFFNYYEYPEDHGYSSSLLAWPLGYQNLLYWLSPTGNAQIHMLPNIIAWISSLLALSCLCLLYLLHPLLSRRIVLPSVEHTGLHRQLLICFGGYCLNLLPYLLTEGPLLLYNYLPALVFCHMSLGYIHQQSEHFLRWWGQMTLRALMLALVICSFLFTQHLFPLIYGLPDEQSSVIRQLETFTSWKFIHPSD
ncbi:protein O-mannosyl-transferase 1-like [Watersipora subatra]|uniref:protein O-mannosyl-transferase 1-like n=1 Tax=Watersipora subatra TaxID=2589382 RepID=UPI00355C0652